ncbi:DotH/IcmK family type IV secretion protein [Vibrio fluvialis]|nr:DotH/IcmK family type IV secretion protein [Vibrio fluvialis]MBY7902415.1 DotH/IcmK family type IV secretion protein [Vibrio fluvialis]
MPIEQIAQPIPSSPSISKENLSSLTDDQIVTAKEDLQTRFQTFDEALLELDNLSSLQRMGLRQWAMENYVQEQRQLAKEKQRSKLSSIRGSIEQKIEEKEASNDPTLIVQNRELDDKITEAQRKDIYETPLRIDTQQIDPYGDKMIVINSVTNTPTAVSFFDSLGSPYPIKQISPNDNELFALETVNPNILLISAKDASKYQSIAGFVFLEGVQQPVPISITNNPKSESDVKRNVVLPSISPMSDKQTEIIMAEMNSTRGKSDPAMFMFLNGRRVPQALEMSLIGLSDASQAWIYKNYMYIRTPYMMRYDTLQVERLGTWFIFKAPIRDTYWFTVANREKEVTVVKKDEGNS